jgi:hypothetical protein
MVRNLNLVGLLFNLIGIVVLFRWGMPFRVETGGATYLITVQRDANEIAVERLYKTVGYVGLAMLIAGTVLQMIAAWLT